MKIRKISSDSTFKKQGQTNNPISQLLFNLNPRFTFENFVVGPGNKLAYAAAQAVAKGKNPYYNPLFLYASVGLGKSHLAMAICNAKAKFSQNHKILSISAEIFLEELMSSIKKKDTSFFKERYRNNCDILFIDDVHFFAKKEFTQLELRRTIDYLISRGKQIIFTSLYPAEYIKDMGEDLKSRLGSGLVVQIDPLDYETRKKILIAKARAKNGLIPEDVIDFVAKSEISNVRCLEGILNNLFARAELMNSPIDLTMAREEVCKVVTQRERKGYITIDSIKECVSDFFKIKVEALASKSRKKEISLPRQIAMYLCRKYTEKSLEEIAEAFNKRHSSVIHSIQVIKEHLRRKDKIGRQVNFILFKLEGKIVNNH